jgi:3-hydroxyisobutyrate dehydrogenase-like beta-hydroxyacid dehydrogenase
MNVGFIGTGSMGNPVAQNLISAGHDLVVNDLRPAAADNLLALGADWRSTAAAVAADADFVFLSLPSQVEVEQVFFGADGLLCGIRAGTYVIDLTTQSVSCIPRLTATEQSHGIHYLAAPVSQGVDNAKIGKLSIFVGGSQADYDHCLPLLNCIASTVIHTGDHASAMAAKLLTNMLWFINAVALGEALVLGAKSGIELSVLRQVILHSCGTSWVAEHDIPSVYDGSFDPSFTTRLCTKDLRLISELAGRLNVPIELGATVEQIFRRTENRYGPESPELSVIKHLQEITDTNLQTGDSATLPVDAD